MGREPPYVKALTINVPVVYMARDILILIAYPFQWSE